MIDNGAFLTQIHSATLPSSESLHGIAGWILRLIEYLVQEKFIQKLVIGNYIKILQ